MLGLGRTLQPKSVGISDWRLSRHLAQVRPRRFFGADDEGALGAHRRAVVTFLPSNRRNPLASSSRAPITTGVGLPNTTIVAGRLSYNALAAGVRFGS